MLGRSRIGVGGGVGVDIFRPESESELESLEICRLHRPALNHCILVISSYTRVAWPSYSAVSPPDIYEHFDSVELFVKRLTILMSPNMKILKCQDR